MHRCARPTVMGGGGGDTRGATGVVVLVVLILEMACLSSVSGEWHIPSIFSSRSGVTKAYKRSPSAGALRALRGQWTGATGGGGAGAVVGTGGVLPGVVLRARSGVQPTKSKSVRLPEGGGAPSKGRPLQGTWRPSKGPRAKEDAKEDGAAAEAPAVSKKAPEPPKKPAGGGGVCMGAKKPWTPFPIPKPIPKTKPPVKRPAGGGGSPAALNQAALSASPPSDSASDGGGLEADPLSGSERRRRLLASTIKRVNPLARYCRLEERARPPARGGLLAGARMLAACLSSGETCSRPERAVRAAARALPGVKMLMRKPRCLVTNRATCPVVGGHVETEKSFVGQSWLDKAKALAEGRSFKPAQKDLGWRRHASCAVVGNAPSLRRAPNGAAIDAHDAVFRFNQIMGADPTRKFSRYTGRRTTYRVFARLPAYELMTGTLKLAPSPGEQWLFWHAHIRHFIPAMVARGVHSEDALLMFSPANIQWMMDAYFQLRRDLLDLGLGPFSCPVNVNSGLHAVLMGQHMCRSISTFGLSYLEADVRTGHMNDGGHRMTTHHSWAFDTMALRVLKFAGLIDVCTK